MMKGDHGPTKLLHALTWGASNHASHAPQVRACNYHLQYYTYDVDLRNNSDNYVDLPFIGTWTPPTTP